MKSRTDAMRDDYSLPPTNYQLVAEFHEKFGLGYGGPPRQLDDDLISFRIGFLIEELAEYSEASGYKIIASELHHLSNLIRKKNDYLLQRSEERDLEKQLDSLVDLNYVSDGTAYLHGFDFDEAYWRVHQANMQKIRVEAKTLEGSVRKSKYDVVKPDGWKPASLSDLVAGNTGDQPVKDFPGTI